MDEQLDSPSVTPETDPATALVPVDPPVTDERHSTWMAQLQSMIDDVTTAAAPALREVAAKAAELAAKAGDAAGPFAHRAASVTTDVGQRVATRGREIAADLRKTADGMTGAGAPDDVAAADAVLPLTGGDADDKPRE